MNHATTLDTAVAPAQPSGNAVARALHQIADTIREVKRMRREAQERFPHLQF